MLDVSLKSKTKSFHMCRLQNQRFVMAFKCIQIRYHMSLSPSVLDLSLSQKQSENFEI